MKRFFACILAVLLAFSLTSCTSDTPDLQDALSQASVEELQKALSGRLAEEEDASSYRVPDEPDGGDENLAQSLKDRITQDGAPDTGGVDTPSDAGNTSSQTASQSSVSGHEPQTDPDPDSVTVYVTKSGEKYHRDGCQYLRKSKIETTLSSAKARGYTPCSKCNPPA